VDGVSVLGRRILRAMSRSLAVAALSLLVLVTASLASAQVRTPPPVIERLEPTSGPPGTTVQIVGRFFRTDQTVLLGEVELPATSRLPNRWTVTIPEGAASGHVRVRLADGTMVEGPELRVLAAPEPPVASALSPTHAAPGAEVRITGERFSPRITENTVTLGALPVVIVPTGATTGPFSIAVTGNGTTTSPPLIVDVGVAITSFAPAVASPGTRIAVEGTGFAARARDVRLFVNGTSARVVTATATHLEFDVPAAATTGTLLVELAGGGRAYSTSPLTILPAPTVASVEPESGVVGATLTIHGAHFGTDIREVAVSIHGQVLTVRNVTDTDITAEIPAGASTDRISVAIHGLPAVLSPHAFTVLVPVAVTAFAPENGGPGTEVTITGTGFSTTAGQDHVTMSGLPCHVLSASATELRVRIPETSSGPLIVEVQHAGTARTPRPFVVTTPPSITRFEPEHGTPGTVVRIVGTHFGSVPGIVEVTMGGRPMPIRSLTDTQIEAAVPSGSTGGTITVSVRLQGSATSSHAFRTLVDMSVTAMDPATAYPSQTVLLRGTGLNQEGLTVTFNGSRAPATLGAPTTSELRVVVPADATTGSVTVRTEDGRTSTVPFTLAETPSGVGITEVVPTCTHGGCEVLVRGYGFATRPTGQTVTMGTERVRVRRTSRYEMTLTIPARATGSLPIHVDVRGTGAADSTPITITAE
jgi:hypothetical protein